MTDVNEAGDVHREEFEIAVNTRPFNVEKSEVTFKEVVELAFPGGTSDPQHMFRVDFEDAASHPQSGSLAESEHVEVKHKGTEFSVFRSVRS